MSLNLKKLTSDAVFAAAAEVEAKGLRLRHSTGYDVIINGKRYPPKEIVRIAYRLLTGEDIGIIYGGEQVNKPLRDLQFEVISKAYVWKLGCNWGRGAPSFYNFIKEHGIVISVKDSPFRVGDLVVITEGFTAYSIALVTEPMQSITAVDTFEDPCNALGIDFEDYVTYSKAEWYELPKTQVFTYQLQAGIRRIRQRQVIDNVIDIWENRASNENKIKFYYLERNTRPSMDVTYPCFVLHEDNWDDFTFRTSFVLTLYRSREKRIEIGPIKILQRQTSTTTLPAVFDFLTEEFCSLGQTIDFYRRLKSESDDYASILNALRDCAFNFQNRINFENELGFKKSLIRSSEAEALLRDAQLLLNGFNLEKHYKFKFYFQLQNASSEHVVDFLFDSQSELPNRFFAIIGRNATGKTQVLAQLAKKLVNYNEKGRFDGSRPDFTKVVTVSFSYFDNFKLPEETDTNYSFIGIRDSYGIVNDEKLMRLVWNAFVKISKEKSRKEFWLQCVSETLEKEYLNFRFEELLEISNAKEFIRKTQNIFSSGQKILFLLFTELLSVMESNSLLIFDEPETHLHPNIAGRLLKTLKQILDKYQSYCILSTHSPIIIQEIPSKYIRVFDRQETTPLIYKPVIECLGENLSNISNSIFYTNVEKQLYKTQLDDLAIKFSLEQIDSLFENKLSLNARLYLQTLIKTR